MTVLAGDLIIACMNFVTECDRLFWRRYLGVVSDQEINEITNEKVSASDGSTLPDGIGLSLVLTMILSISLSTH